MLMKKVVDLQLNSLKETLALAKLTGLSICGGEVIELVSDLGGGKTTFVKGLVEAAGSHDMVTSPSFTIRNDYRAKNFNIVHFDFYRLSNPGILSDMLKEVLNDQKNVVIVEWGEIVSDILPEDRLKIRLIINGQNSRKAEIDLPLVGFDLLRRELN